VPPSGSGSHDPALGHALSGSLGTAISKLLLYPLDLVITRLQVQAIFKNPDAPADNDDDYNNLLDAATKIYNQEGGLTAFYSGVVPDVAKSVADSFLFFLAYNYFRQRRLSSRRSPRSLPVVDEIAVGMLAGTLSKLCTTPVQNVVTRKQTASLTARRSPFTSPPHLTLKDIALQIRDEKGWQGFWSGYSASLVLTLNPAITFLLHKILLRTLVPKTRRDDPGARLTFLIAAVSKSVASSVTYPFSLAKTRAQVSSQPPSDPSGTTSEIGEDKEVVREAEAAIVVKARKARQRTVLATILRIAKTEGVGALYHGLGPEVLKGFFSHGLTMLMKERIHGLIVSLYYLVFKAAKRYPNPQEIRAQANGVFKGGKTQVAEFYEGRKGEVGDALEKGREMAGNASGYAGEALANGKTQAGELLERGRDLASNASKQAQDLLDKGRDGAKEVISNGNDGKE